MYDFNLEHEVRDSHRHAAGWKRGAPLRPWDLDRIVTMIVTMIVFLASASTMKDARDSEVHGVVILYGPR